MSASRAEDFLDVESLASPEAVERERFLTRHAAEAAAQDIATLRRKRGAHPGFEDEYNAAKARHQALLHRLGHLRRRHAALIRPNAVREQAFSKEAAFVRAARSLLTGDQFDAIWREVDRMRDAVLHAGPERGSLSALPPQSPPPSFRRRKEERP